MTSFTVLSTSTPPTIRKHFLSGSTPFSVSRTILHIGCVREWAREREREEGHAFMSQFAREKQRIRLICSRSSYSNSRRFYKVARIILVKVPNESAILEYSKKYAHQGGLLIIHRKYNRSKLRSCITNFKRKTPAKMTPIACKVMCSSKAHQIFNVK